MTEGLRIERRYTSERVSPYDTVEWTRRDSKITNPDGSVVFEMKDAEVPAQLVAGGDRHHGVEVLPQGRRAPVRRATATPVLRRGRARPITGPERSARQVIHRLAGMLALLGREARVLRLRERRRGVLRRAGLHAAAPDGGPQLARSGSTPASTRRYGITGTAQGFWYVDPETERSRRLPRRLQPPRTPRLLHHSIDDDLVNPGGIMDLWVREARLFKMGAGTGANFSHIRAEGEPLSGGGKSSGLMSFLKVGDRAAGAIKSGGTTRRAAKMVILDIDHPDIEAFINWKADEEDKVAALVGRRLPGRLQRRGLRHRLRPELQQLRAPHQRVHPGRARRRRLGLTARTDGAVMKTVKARDLWDQIADAAWRCADPGVQFDTTINEWHTCPADGRHPRHQPVLASTCSSTTPPATWRRSTWSRSTTTRPATSTSRATARHPAVDHRARDLRADGAVPRQGRSPSAATTTARSASATPTSARC